MMIIKNDGSETKEEYLAAEGLSRSHLKYIDESLARMTCEMYQSTIKETEALKSGKMIHELILEPELINKYVSDEDVCQEIMRGGSKNPRRTNDYKAWKASEELIGKIVLNANQAGEFLENAHMILASLKENEQAMNMVRVGQKEFAMTCKRNGQRVKACADILVQSDVRTLLVDVKTIDAIITQDELEKYFYNYEVHVQASWYSYIAKEVFGNPVTFFVIWVGKNKPYPVIMQQVGQEAMEVGNKIIEQKMKKIHEAMLGNEERVSDIIGLPMYAINRYTSEGLV